jgi:hypothetical protein
MVGKGKRKKKTALVVSKFKTATVSSTATQASATSGIWGRTQLQYFELDDSLKSILCVWLALFNQVQVHFSTILVQRISVFSFFFPLPWTLFKIKPGIKMLTGSNTNFTHAAERVLRNTRRKGIPEVQMDP